LYSVNPNYKLSILLAASANVFRNVGNIGNIWNIGYKGNMTGRYFGYKGYFGYFWDMDTKKPDT
jgi:hypothetical protein